MFSTYIRIDDDYQLFEQHYVGCDRVCSFQTDIVYL